MPMCSRIEQFWLDCRARFGEGGPFLFGKFTAADAMYAPVVSRFVSYAIGVVAKAEAYMEAIQTLPAWQEWKTASLAEPWTMPGNESALTRGKKKTRHSRRVSHSNAVGEYIRPGR